MMRGDRLRGRWRKREYLPVGCVIVAAWANPLTWFSAWWLRWRPPVDGLIARDDVGMPPGMVREDALIAASVMIAAIAGTSSRKRKQ
jgi:hypothetical protein